LKNVSLLIFIYFISSFFSKEDLGTQFFIIFSLITINFVNLKIDILDEIFDITNFYYISIFQINPISFMILSFLKILKLGPSETKYYLFISYIVHFLNILFYGGALIFIESKVKCLKCKNNKKELNKSIHEKINSEINNICYQRKIKYDMNNQIVNSNEIFIENESNRNRKKNNNNHQKTIEIKGLVKIFKHCCNKNIKNLKINKDIYLTNNEKLGILGNNGSGRTMIFKSIINEISYDEGSIDLFGYDSRKDFNKVKSKIGYCPQINIEFNSMKVTEIIQFFINLKSQKITPEFLCQKFCLQNYLDTDYNNLSFGNKRKLFLLISLINYPELLLLDDPFNSVDDISKKIIKRYLNKLFNNNIYNCNIVISANSLEDIFELCDRNIILNAQRYDDVDRNSDFENIEIYKLFIKFNNSLNSKEEISNQTIKETLIEISMYIEGFDAYTNYFLDNIRLEPYLKKLLDIINKIIENINFIKLTKIGDNLSFEFDIEFIQKRIVYTKLINIANDKSNLISEFKILKMNKLNIET